MAPHDATIAVETWAVRERALPRVPPDSWATTDRLRTAVCLAIESSVDGITRVEPFDGAAKQRERFDAVVTAEEFDDEHVRLVEPRSVSDGDAGGDGEPAESDTGGGEAFEERTEQFDIDEALDRL